MVGYDDIEFARLGAVPLTTIRTPQEGLGVAVAELLLAEMASDRAEGERPVVRQLELRPELVSTRLHLWRRRALEHSGEARRAAGPGGRFWPPCSTARRSSPLGAALPLWRERARAGLGRGGRRQRRAHARDRHRSADRGRPRRPGGPQQGLRRHRRPVRRRRCDGRLRGQPRGAGPRRRRPRAGVGRRPARVDRAGRRARPVGPPRPHSRRPPTSCGPSGSSSPAQRPSSRRRSASGGCGGVFAALAVAALAALAARRGMPPVPSGTAGSPVEPGPSPTERERCGRSLRSRSSTGSTPWWPTRSGSLPAPTCSWSSAGPPRRWRRPWRLGATLVGLVGTVVFSAVAGSSRWRRRLYPVAGAGLGLSQGAPRHWRWGSPSA